MRQAFYVLVKHEFNNIVFFRIEPKKIFHFDMYFGFLLLFGHILEQKIIALYELVNFLESMQKC